MLLFRVSSLDQVDFTIVNKDCSVGSSHVSKMNPKSQSKLVCDGHVVVVYTRVPLGTKNQSELGLQMAPI